MTWSMTYSKAEPRVPIQIPVRPQATIPTKIAELVYEEYRHQFGNSQSFERLHERGGFGYAEAISLLADLIERERGKKRRDTTVENY